MLVLSRKKEEGLVIGENIRIYVLGVEDGKVKIGIDAPKSVSVVRMELYDEVQETNKAAAGSKLIADSLKRQLSIAKAQKKEKNNEN